MLYTTFLKSAVSSALYQLKFGFFNCRSIHCRNKRNYYDVLELTQNCTIKDIKEAYILLSKRYHPDRNNSINTQQFLDVAEAYSVLSKADLRRKYDSSIFPKPMMKQGIYYEETRSKQNPMDDPSFYCNRNKSKDQHYEAKPYYGIKGLPRVSNSIILVGCLLLMAVGVTVQVLAIRHSVTFKREELMYQSLLAHQKLEESRKRADQNGNQMQLALLEEKFRRLG